MINTTARLVDHARPGEVLMLLRTYEAIAERYPDAAARAVATYGESQALQARAITVVRAGATTRGRELVTILFLDLVESTQLADRIGDAAWRDLLARHYAALREALLRYGGSEVDTAGDGLLATFRAPIGAIQFAESAVVADSELGLMPRIGIHTGEVEFDGSAIRRIAVVIAARIAALGGRKQVLVSNTVRDLVAGSGLAFADLGVRALKGIPERRQVFQLVPSRS